MWHQMVSHWQDVQKGKDVPRHCRGVCVKVVGNCTMVDTPAARDWLHVVLGDILGDAHRSKYALAVVCSTPSQGHQLVTSPMLDSGRGAP